MEPAAVSLLSGTLVQENAASKQAGLDEAPAETGTALAGRQTLEVLSGAESIADALELAAAEAERHRVRTLLPCRNQKG